MTRAAMAQLALACGLCALAACSKIAANATAARESAGAPVAAPNACDRKLVTQADMAGILGEPVTSMATLPGDPQTCVFQTASSTSVTVSLRPGIGRMTVDTWAAGKMPISATPLAGVGERAVWQSTLHEVIAEKGNVLCDIGVAGPPAATAAATPARVGALCAKIFAAGA